MSGAVTVAAFVTAGATGVGFAAAGAAVAVGGTVLATVFWVRWRREEQFLRGFLARVVPEGVVRQRDDLVALRQAIREAVSFRDGDQEVARPLLRHSAQWVLEHGRGFCGENARVAVRLLRLGGVRAHRLYLFGPRWGHVVVAHRWDGGWRLFDAHDDARTLPADEDLGVVAWNDLSRFTNAVADNPWTEFSWARPLRPVAWLAHRHPPRWLSLVAESPDLVRAGVALAAALGGVAIVVAMGGPSSILG